MSFWKNRWVFPCVGQALRTMAPVVRDKSDKPTENRWVFPCVGQALRSMAPALRDKSEEHMEKLLGLA